MGNGWQDGYKYIATAVQKASALNIRICPNLSDVINAFTPPKRYGLILISSQRMNN